MTTRNALVAGSVLVMVSVMFVLLIRQRLQHEIDTLAPQARKYQEMCRGVKVALRGDRTLLQSERERERDLVVARVAGDHGGGDSFLMLERCLPMPFPIEAWRRCRESNDVPCMIALLQRVENSVE